MLKELHIQNFAIIEKLSLFFQPGLIIFTGETGAGKSIILDSLSAILGERMDTTVIRQGESKAIVEGLFELESQTKSALRELLEPEGLWDDEDYLTLGREIRAEGRTIARVNGRMVNLGLQSEIGALLVDLHGQSEHLSLLKTRNHRILLDRYAHNKDLLEAYQAEYKRWQALNEKLRELNAIDNMASERIDILRYQIQEIESAKLQPGEDEELRSERTRLANVEALSTFSQQALVAIDEGSSESSAATDLVGQAAQCLHDLARIDASTQALAERAEEALSSLADIAYELRDYLEAIEYNPVRLDQVEERLNTLQILKKKYGGSTESVLAHLDKIKREIENIDTLGEQIKEVIEKINSVKLSLSEKALSLSKLRKSSAEKMQEAVSNELNALQMQKARFMVQIAFSPSDDGLLVDNLRLAFDQNGIDQIEFLIETNPGEGFKPLAKIASGGETSRLMLALKHVLAEADQTPTLVFDEIDSGIGGRVGMTVGKMLWQLGREHQVLCVTHLPQLAAFADQHYKASKHESAGRTLTNVHELDTAQRERELANMLGGETQSILQSAREILATVSEFTGTIHS
ncbi:MAG TPA: DNA repair protein RecN [Anaerolineaceae bacterium]|nr:DNA repair protein RecN [Anaerolineaceae bacterium]HQC63811.1 DNA repair protein RecN [Anaerolineaceae bacterium]